VDPSAPPPFPLTESEKNSKTELSRSTLLSPEQASLAPAERVRPSLPTREAPPRRSFLRATAVAGSKALVVLALAWGLAFNLSEVRGSSMEPGIHDRDRILVDQMSYLFSTVTRGDVVVLRYPLDPSLDYIKRVVGLPGDEVVIARGQVFINGEELAEPYVSEASIEPWTSMRTTVRPGHYFVLGDNRRRSSDSREFGQVAAEYLRGKVRLRLWPMGRFGVIQ
jgi:signal peptidase I